MKNKFDSIVWQGISKDRKTIAQVYVDDSKSFRAIIFNVKTTKPLTKTRIYTTLDRCLKELLGYQDITSEEFTSAE